MFNGKRILITGGTGSFGHQMVQDLLSREPTEIRIFSRDEKKQHDMQLRFQPRPEVTFVLGDVRDKPSVRSATRDIDIIFHAAALKQVPRCEYNVLEAIKTNVLGTHNVIEAALCSGVQKVIAIGSDKAVKPVNVYGMTKGLQERLLINADLHKGDRDTIFTCVRYGNVLGSRGSVIPLFKKQIAYREPLTITHKEMTRFLLTLRQATYLVFTAIEQGEGGTIFVCKVRSARVMDIAQIMLEEADSPYGVVREIGIRPGEKIHEILISEEESWRTTDYGDHFVVAPGLRMALSQRREGLQEDFERWEYNSGSPDRLMRRDELRVLLKEEGFC